MRKGQMMVVKTYQSTHCGKTDWKVSVQEHLITSMNAPGLKRTCDLIAKHRDLVS